MNYSSGFDEATAPPENIKLIANYRFSKLYATQFTTNLLYNKNLTKPDIIQAFCDNYVENSYDSDTVEVIKMLNRSLYLRDMVESILNDQETRKAVLLTMINNSTRSIIKSQYLTKQEKLDFINNFLAGFDQNKKNNVITFYQELFSWDDEYQPHLLNPVERTIRSYYFSTEISMIIQDPEILKEEKMLQLEATEFVSNLRDVEKATALFWYSEMIEESQRLARISKIISEIQSSFRKSAYLNKKLKNISLAA